MKCFRFGRGCLVWLMLLLASAASGQSPITRNNLIANGGFDAGQAPWEASGQGIYFYNAGGDTIASVGWTNGSGVRQGTTSTLDTNTDLVITIRARSGDGNLEGVRLALQDLTAGLTLITNLDAWFPPADMDQNPGAWRIFALPLRTRSWPALQGHELSVAISARDTAAWGQLGWLHLDWVQLAPALPRFLTQPQPQAAPLGTAATLTTTAAGAVLTNGPAAGDLAYQWFKAGGIPVPAATKLDLFFPSVAAADAGTYYLMITNHFGVAQSSNVTLTVLPAETPAYLAAVDPELVYVDNFEGWGTSLCWWAKVIGEFSNRQTYADMAFTQLRLNIVRYNIGGGENPGISNTMEFRARVPGFQPSPGVWDWTADANQRWMLRAAVDRGADRVVAFANSPPWYMTVSGSVTGSTNGTSDNLLTSSETDFAVYLATVISNLTVLDGIQFDYATPMNEPNSSWWKLGGRQEGCPMSAAQQARMVNALRTELAARGMSQAIQASEDTDQQRTINSMNGYSATALSNVTCVASHTYGANNPSGVRNLAHSLGKPLWMSEYGDGDGTGMTMARRIRNDLTGMWCKAWVYWQVVDNAGGWGMIYNPMDGTGNSAYTINRKFYVMAQFSRFIRPGDRLLIVDDVNSVAAYNPASRTLVIVSVNDTTNGFNAGFDLSRFATLPLQAARHRTSPSENLVALPALALAGNQLTSYLAAQSVTTHVLTNAIPAAPSDNPTAWYMLESNPNDSSGNSHHGTASSIAYGAGKLGASAAQFNGSNAYVRVPLTVSNHFTLALWVKTTTTAATGQWWAGKGLIDGEVNGNTDDFGLVLSGNKAGFGIGNPDTTITSSTAINDGAWHHVAATRDAFSGRMRLYVDGVLQTTVTGPVGPRAAPPYLRIGSIQTGASAGYLTGSIDDVQIFNRVFAPEEITKLMNHAPVIDPIPNATILAGRTLVVTNSALDPDTPAQTLSWSLASPPTGVTINGSSGLLTWRPAISQAPYTHLVNVVVSDNGTPSGSSTQTFNVTVNTPTSPTLLSPVHSNGLIRLEVATGDAGPDYIFETVTNLAAPRAWLPVYTNLSAAPPFSWTNTAAPGNRFYRLRLGP